MDSVFRFFSCLILSLPLYLEAQVRGKIAEEQILKNFFSFGGQILTRGWDVNIQYERARVKDRHLFVLHASHLKDRAELKRESLFRSQNGTNFIMNKVNYLMVLHAGYGRSFVLFDRNQFSKAQLSAGFVAGPTLGFLIPYKIYRFVPIQGNLQLGYREEATFYDGVAYEDVIGEMGIVQGSRDMKYCPGISLQGRLQLDLGEKADFIRSVLLSLRADCFVRDITLLLPYQQKVFYSGGIGFMLGNAW